jgi:hypothetical protein
MACNLTNNEKMYTGAFTHLLDLPIYSASKENYELAKNTIIKIMEESFPNSSYSDSEDEIGEFYFSIGFFEHIVIDFVLCYEPEEYLGITWNMFDLAVEDVDGIDLVRKPNETDIMKSGKSWRETRKHKWNNGAPTQGLNPDQIVSLDDLYADL